MSLVNWGTTSTDPETVLEYPDGGVFVAYFDASTLGAVTLTVEAYTQVHQGSDEVLYGTWTIVGPTPADPGILEAGPIVSALPVRIVVSGASSIPFWIMSEGQVSTVELGEGTLDTQAGENTLVTTVFGGTFYLLVDRTQEQAGDDLKLRLRTTFAATASNAVTHYALVEDAPTTSFIARLGPLVAPEVAQATLEQSVGTLRDYPYALLQLGA